MSSDHIEQAFEAVWQLNESSCDLSEAHKDLLLRNLSAMILPKQIIIEWLRQEVGEDTFPEEMLEDASYHALLESERGEDEETIALRGLYKLEATKSDNVVVSVPESQETNEEVVVPHAPVIKATVFERVRAGDVEAKSEIIERYGKFAISVARKAAAKLNRRVNAIDVDDLAQEALIGLLRAAELYEKGARGATFLTYANFHIRGRIMGHVEDMSSTVRVPRHIRQKINKIERVNWYRRHDRKPLLSAKATAKLVEVDESEVVAHTGSITVGTLRFARLISDNMGSLDTGFSPHNDVSPGNDYILDERNSMNSVTGEADIPVDEAAELATLPKLIDEALEELDEREKAILRLRFGLGGTEPRTLEEVGEEFNLTGTRIRTIEAQALAKLRSPWRLHNLVRLLDR